MKDKHMYIGENMYRLMPLFQSKIRIERIKSGLFELGFTEHLNKNHIRAMFLLSRRGDLISSQLGKLLGLERGSITTLVKHLINSSFVEKKQCETDKRKQFLSITDKGKDFVKELDKLYLKEIKFAFDKLDEKDLNIFIESLDTITSIIKKL